MMKLGYVEYVEQRRYYQETSTTKYPALILGFASFLGDNKVLAVV